MSYILETHYVQYYSKYVSSGQVGVFCLGWTLYNAHIQIHHTSIIFLILLFFSFLHILLASIYEIFASIFSFNLLALNYSHVLFSLNFNLTLWK